MNDGIGGVDQAVVVIAREAKLVGGNISAKNADSRLQIFVEEFEIQVELQSLPETFFGLARIASAHQQVQRCAMLGQQVRGGMGANVSSPSGQENRHVAPFVPVLTVSVSVPRGCRLRGGRASSGRPSIKG